MRRSARGGGTSKLRRIPHFSDEMGFNALDLCDSGVWILHREHFIRHF
jgi:hypothetical protein